MAMCDKCGGAIVVLLNTAECVYGCKKTDSALRFPKFWSRYLSPPRFLPTMFRSADQLYAEADCVLGFNTQGDTRVFVVKNDPWPTTAGRWYTTTPEEWTAIFHARTMGTDKMMKENGCLSMAALVV